MLELSPPSTVLTRWEDWAEEWTVVLGFAQLKPAAEPVLRPGTAGIVLVLGLITAPPEVGSWALFWLGSEKPLFGFDFVCRPI